MLHGLNASQRAAVEHGTRSHAGLGWCRQRQDARDHHAHRAPARRGRAARADPGGQLHQQGRRGNARAHGAAGRRPRPPSGSCCPRSTASACASCRRRTATSATTAASSSSTRPTPLGLVRELMRQARTGDGDRKLDPMAILSRISLLEERAQGARGDPRDRLRVRRRRARRLPASTSRGCATCTRSTSTTWSCCRCASWRSIPHVREKWQQRFPLHPDRRVSGHQRRAAARRCCCWPTSSATCAWWATTTSPSTAGVAPTCATSWSSSSTFPGAKIIKLEDNYRSRAAVLDVANAAIAQTASTSATRRPCAPRAAPAIVCASCRATIPDTRRASWSKRSRTCTAIACPTRTWPSCIARTCRRA